MPTNREALLCRYHYDPLDRLVACTPSEQASAQRFYLKNSLATEIQGSEQRSIFQQEDQLLAQQQRQIGSVETTLLATDQQRSVLNALAATRPHLLAYTPYGHRAPENGLLCLLGFNGERPDPVTGCYLLGNGYRAFNPVLMRFNSPDKHSPFAKGGLNTYVYCLGDPINLSDPTGQFAIALTQLAGLFETVATHAENIVGTLLQARRAGFLGYAELAINAGYVSMATGTTLQLAGYSAGGVIQNTGAALLSVGAGMKSAHRAVTTLGKNRVVKALVQKVQGKKPGANLAPTLSSVSVEQATHHPRNMTKITMPLLPQKKELTEPTNNIRNAV
ncbi:RHS repeat-associated core domain-containing protein [Pseudomonas sp. Sample_10]|uniref:RHS repeat-associated core domain-containing protein n=1 Tax=Pseudomonas sp. Sample_10 TaxID=2448269 RepID=UPI00103607FE|nr:RHS repeat-associated core domain-containing protein [Pseudomonas sp. Sample_10]